MATKKSSPPNPPAAAPRLRRAPVLGRASAEQPPEAVRESMTAAQPEREMAHDWTTQAASSPTHQEIAEAAYLRYVERGGGDGHDVDDWVEAERELRRGR